MQTLSVIFTDYCTERTSGICYELNNKNWWKYRLYNTHNLPTIKIQEEFEEKIRFIGEKPKVNSQTQQFTINLCGNIL